MLAIVASAPGPRKQARNGAPCTFRCLLMISRTKKVSAARMVQGVHRPGAMEHAIPGLSKKVLNERLRKLVRFGVLEREAYPEVPPRVEYRLTPFGEKFAVLMDGVERLQRQLDAD